MSASQDVTYAGLKGRPLGLFISTISTTGFLLFGYDQGVMSGIIGAKQFNAYFPDTLNDSVYQGFVTAIYEIGCLIGAIFILSFGDNIGRRRAIILGGIIMIFGVLIQVTSFQGHHATLQLIIGRTITGVGNGINTSTIPTYQAECSRTTNRGLLICIEGGVIAFGTMIAYWIDYGCSFSPIDDFTWRFPIAFQIIFGLVVSIGGYFLPESPRWLLTKDRHDEAIRVIAAIRGTAVDSEETKIEKAIIVDSIVASGHNGEVVPFKALLTNGKTQHFRRMILGAAVQIMQQFGGCNAVIYYFPILFEKSVHTTPQLALLLGGINMVVYSIFATTSWFIIERAGRRQILLWGSAGQMCSMIIVFACLIPGQVVDGIDSPVGIHAAYGAAFGLFAYIAFFGATLLPLPWLYPAEINPLRTRARANAVSTCGNWLSNFLIVMITPIMISNIQWGTYLFFACTNACFIPIIYFFYPETKRRSLEEIDLIFAKGYTEKISYVHAAQQLPYLNDREIAQMTRDYGVLGEDEEKRSSGSVDEKGDLSEKEDGVARESEGNMRTRTESNSGSLDNPAQQVRD